MEGNRKKHVKKEQNTTNQALLGGVLELVYIGVIGMKTLLKSPKNTFLKNRDFFDFLMIFVIFPI